MKLKIQKFYCVICEGRIEQHLEVFYEIRNDSEFDFYCPYCGSKHKMEVLEDSSPPIFKLNTVS